jgi:hypothetical protein
MPINRDLVDPAELTDQTRKALAEFEVNSPNSLAKYLPSETLDDIEYEADAGQGGLIEAAMYRAYDAGLAIGRDEALGKLRGRIQPLGQKIPITEEARLRLRKDAETSLRADIERKAKRIAHAVATQVNLKRAEALVNAELDFVGNGVNIKVPFGRKPEFTTVLTKLWSDETADPIEDLIILCDAYEAENGFRPSEMLTGQAAKTAFYRHPKVTAMAIGTLNTGQTPQRIAAPSEVDALLSLYNLPSFTVNTGKVKVRNLDQTSTIKFLIPQDSIILLADGGDAREADSSQLGATFWGVTIEATKADWGIEESEWAGIVTAVFDNDTVPAFMSVEGSAIATPVLINPNYSLKAKVV